MIIAYFDSSLLLSFLLRENKAEEARDIWQRYDVKISSSLLKIETNIVLRRSLSQKKNNPNEFSLEDRLAELDKFLKDIFYKRIDDVFKEPYTKYAGIANCKSLDAIHIATALDIRDNSNYEIHICSFDKNIIKLAEQFGFAPVGR